MKKSISFILAFCLIISMLTVVPVEASAVSEEKIYKTVINNYDEDGVTYANDTSVSNSYKVYRSSSDDTALELTQWNATVKECTVDTTVGKAIYIEPKSNNYINTQWPHVISIYDNDADNYFEVQDGVKYRLSFKYWSETDPSNYDLVIRLQRMKSGVWKYESERVIGEVGRITDATDEWKTVSYEFTGNTTDDYKYLKLNISCNTTNTKSYTTNTKVWIDDITIIPIYDITCHNYDGVNDKVITVDSLTTFGELEAPLRDGYKFAGFYKDIDLSVSATDNELIGSATELWVKWERITGVKNTYDESDVTYSDTDSGVGTNRTVGDSTIQLSNYQAKVETDTANSTNKALHFYGSVKNSNSSSHRWPNAANIYDSNETNAFFTTTVGTTYKISFKYRSDTTPDKELRVFVAYNGLADGTKWDDGIYYRYVNAVSITATTEDWTTVETTFTATSSNPLMLKLNSNHSSGWATNVNLWIDDITVTELLTVTCHNGNAEDNYYPELDSTFEAIPEPEFSGAVFEGYYMDSDFTTPVDSNALIDESTEIWGKWSAYEKVDFNTEANSSFTVNDDYSKTELVSEGGVGGTGALSSTKAGGLWDGGWPAQLTLLNPDGTSFVTTPGHSYRVTLSIKATDNGGWQESATADGEIWRQIYVTNAKGKVTTIQNGCYSDKDGNLAVKMLNNYAYGTDFVEITIDFTEKSSTSQQVYIVLYQMSALIDDCSIIDTTVLPVTDSTVENDVNRDGECDLRDFVRMKKMAAQLVAINEYADTYKEDYIAVNANDIAAMRRIMLSLEYDNVNEEIPAEYATVTIDDVTRSLVWNDEFDSDSLDTSKWYFRQTMTTNESNVYSNDSEHVNVADGKLNMKITSDGSKLTLPQGVTTYNTMNFKYGYLEVKATIPYSTYAFPSIWMMEKTAYHANTDYGLEIDIFEGFGGKSAYSNLHKWNSGNRTTVKDEYRVVYEGLTDAAEVTFGFLWTESSMTYYMNGIELGTVDFTLSVFEDDSTGKIDDYHYLIFNNEAYIKDTLLGELISGYDYSTTVNGIKNNPISYSIDYVRLYQTDAEQILK